MNASLARAAQITIRSNVGGRRRLPHRRVLQLNYSTTPTMSSTAVVTSENNLPTKPIDFAVSAKIEGDESQVAIVTLRPGERLRAESGAMLFMTHGVEMKTDLQGASSAFSRMMTGQNMFLTDFEYAKEDGEGTVGLGTDFPSKIVRLTLDDYENSSLICQRGALLASNPSVDIQIEFTKKLGTGFFGGQGFILQKLTGEGDVLIKAGGTLVTRDLEEGETLRVTSGSIVAFTPTVEYDIQMLSGIKNVMFGGEGLFVTTLTGPGRIWLQGMPPDRMIAEIASRVPSGGPGIGIPIGIGGGGGDGGANDAGAAEGAAAAGGAAADPGGDGGAAAATAATDQAVDADRQATVASSGMMGSEGDGSTPSELYGDVAASSPDPLENYTSNLGHDDGASKETTFTDDNTASTVNESTFSDDDSTSFSTDEFEQPKNDFWAEADQSSTDVFDSGAVEDSEESVSSIFSTLWDLFTGNDD